MDITTSNKDIEQAQRDIKDLSAVMPKVAVRVLNKSMTGTKTDAVNIVRSEYNFKAASLKKRMKVYRASRSSLAGKVTSKGKVFHLTDLTGTRQTKKGVTVDVKKSTGRLLIPRAFIRPGQNSEKRIVFRRMEKGGEMVGRYPIGARTAPFPEDIYNTPENWAKIKKAVAERIDKNIDREVSAEFRKYRGKWI